LNSGHTIPSRVILDIDRVRVLQSGKLLVIIAKGIVTGSGTDLISFAFDAVSEFHNGEVFSPNLSVKLEIQPSLMLLWVVADARYRIYWMGVAGYLITDIAGHDR